MKCKEGYPDFYGEIPETIECLGKKYNKVKTYKVIKEKEKSDHQRPTKEYMNLILNNAKKYGFPEEYIEYLEGIEIK